MPQPSRHHLPNGVQSPNSSILDTGPGGSGDLQRNGKSDGLLIVEQQWRQPSAGVETVAAIRPLDGMDGIAEFTKTVDVAADGARADLQPFGQQGARPVAAGLQERQQGEQSR